MNSIILQSFEDCSEYIRYIEYPTDKKYIINIENPKQWTIIYNKHFKKLPKTIFIITCNIPWITQILQSTFKFGRHHVWNEDIYVDPRIQGVWVSDKHIRYYYNFSDVPITFLSNSCIDNRNRYGYICYRFLRDNFDKIVDIIVDMENIKHYTYEFIQELYKFDILNRDTNELGSTGKMIEKYILEENNNLFQ
jgi:hypothetical protein